MRAGVFMIMRKPSGKFLMQLRDDGKGKKIWFPNTWVFPGATKEPGEDYLQTVIREAREEFTIELKPEQCKQITVFNFDRTEDTQVFLCSVSEDEEVILNEGAAFQWMKMEEIERLELGFGQNRILGTIKDAVTES